jgi:DNA repair exonuclease SbcCD ATPase subunit
MLAATTSQFTNFLPQIALVAGIASLLGWIMRGLFAKPQPAGKPAASNDSASRERVRNLEGTLEKAKAAQKTLKAELEALKTSSVPTANLEKVTAELETARKAVDIESKRISALETDLKRAQETIKNLNSRANDADKVQKDRSFALENELSKTRQQLAILESRPDNTSELHAEIERLRESVAVSTRYAGEVRKREAAAVEALEKAQALLGNAGDAPRPAVSTKVGPVMGDSDRVTAAKAEVIRILERNKETAAAEVSLVPDETEPAVEPAAEPAV